MPDRRRREPLERLYVRACNRDGWRRRRYGDDAGTDRVIDSASFRRFRPAREARLDAAVGRAARHRGCAEGSWSSAERRR